MAEKTKAALEIENKQLLEELERAKQELALAKLDAVPGIKAENPVGSQIKDFDQYVESAMRTAKVFNPSNHLNNKTSNQCKTILEVAASVGLLTDTFKKQLFHKHPGELDATLFSELRQISALISDKTSIKVLSEGVSVSREELASIEGIIGVVGESGELAEIFHELYFSGREVSPDAKKVMLAKMFKEVGDVLWYLGRICHANGWSFASIASANIAKLEARYPSGFTPEDSLNRKEPIGGDENADEE